MPQQSINALDRRLYSLNNDGLASAIRRSTEQTILVADMISEGPIEGLVGGGAGIFLENDALQSTDETSMQPHSGVKARFTANSDEVIVDPGANTFNASVGSDGTKYLMVYGVYSTSVTMSDITLPTSSYTYDGSPYQNSDFQAAFQLRIVPIGGKVTLTKVVGSTDDIEASWAHSTDNSGAAVVTKVETNAVFVNLKLSESGHDLRGGLTDISVGPPNTAVFTWGGQLNWKLLMSDADRANGVVHTLEAGIFLEIEEIDGNTITLASALPNDWVTEDYRFGITAAILDDDATGSERARIEEKYPNSGWSFNSGTIDQSPMPTIEGIGTSSVALTVSDAALNRDASRTITASGAQASEIDEVKILINYPSGLYIVSENSGTEYPAGVAYEIELMVDNGGEEVYNTIPGPNGTKFNGTPVWTHTGKHKSAVQFEMRLSLEHEQPFNGFKIKITRLTKHDPEDTTVIVGNTSGGDVGATSSDLHSAERRHKGVYTSVITSVIGIIKEKLSFPHTAMANVSFSSKSFTNVPTRSYLCQGLKIKVPSNYVTREQGADGKTAKYTRNSSGVITTVAQLWDGTFLDDLVYTDNPAWVFYDVLTNNRYGLGDFLEAQDIDKYSLYKISKYCDELVPDGKGSTEPRFRANIYLTKATDSYKILKDMATIFRGILYWTDSTFRPVIDQKTEPVYNFSRSNIIEGSFNYETTGSKTRVNQMVVEWSNPDSDYKLEPIIVEDRENQSRTGTIKSEKAVAFGCTSEGQAIRYGRWKLWTALNQTEIVNFSTSVNAAFLSPGDVVNIQDESDFNIAFSGRVNSCTTSNITIDRAISSDFSGGYTYTIAVVLPKRTVLLNQDSAVIADNGGGSSTYTRGDNITHATVGGSTTELLYKTTGTVNGAVNNSINVTLSASNSLINVGDTITGTSVDNNITVAAISGTSLTLSAAQTISDTTSLTFENEDLTRRQIESAVDTTGNLLNLQYIAETVVEERTLTTGSTTTADGRDTIPISSAFSVLPTNGDIWAIKQISTSGEKTLASYKPYKILAIAESGEEQYSIVAAEYSDQKFDSVDSEFSLASADPLFPPENTEEVPPPRNLRILTVSDPDQRGEEVAVEWDSPLAVGSSGVSTTYENLAEFKVAQTFHKIGGFGGGMGFGGMLEFLKDGISVPAETRSLKYSGVRNGKHVVTVQTVSGKGRTSKKVSATINIRDVFEGNFPRLGGLVKGGYATSDVAVIDSGAQKGSVKFGKTSLVAAPLQDINKAKRNTSADANSYGLSCVALAHSSWPYQEGGVDLGYLMMDFSAFDAANGSANALKLITRKVDTTTYGRNLDYWYDGIKFVADADSIWTSLGTCTMTEGSSKIVGTGFSSLDIGTVITVGSSYGAKIAYIESNTVMYADYPWVAATASSQAIKRQELVIDYEEDFIIAPVSYNASGTDSDGGSGKYTLGGENNTMSFLQITPELAGIGKSIVVTSSLSFLSYAADDTQLTNIPNTGIVLTAAAIGWTNPEFKFTGTGFSQVNQSAESAFTTGTDNIRDFTVHNNSDDIDYDALPADFTVTVREALDPDNAVTTKSTVYSIGKLKEGSQGVSAAVVYLYKMAASIPASIDDTTSFPQLTVSMTTGKIIDAAGYSISSNQIMDSTGGGTGWYTVVTDTSVTDGVQWVSAATASSTATADTIARTEWTDPVQFSGSAGTSGVSSAIAELYQRTNSTSAPADPDQTLTYTFATGVLANSAGGTSGTGFNSWVKDATSPIESAKYLWKITAPAIATGATDTITSANWAAAIIAAQYGAEGDPGVAGKQTFNSTMYYGSGVISGASAPLEPADSGTFTFSGQTFGTTNANVSDTSAASKWSLVAPTFAPYDGSDNKLVWYACSVKVEETTAGGGIGTPDFSNVHIVHNFFGVVAFTDLSDPDSDITTIHGGHITTGTIQGPNFGLATPNGSTDRGMKIILAPGNDSNSTTTIMEARAQGATSFSLNEKGDAYFAGEIASGKFSGTGNATGSITVGSGNVIIDGDDEQIRINDGQYDRVILGKLS